MNKYIFTRATLAAVPANYQEMAVRHHDVCYKSWPKKCWFLRRAGFHLIVIFAWKPVKWDRLYLVPGMCLRQRTGASVRPPCTTLKSRSAQRAWTQHARSDECFRDNKPKTFLFCLSDLIRVCQQSGRQTKLQNFIFRRAVSGYTHGWNLKKISLSAINSKEFMQYWNELVLP